ncbi:hypothetical protein CTAYLR_007697 [Chrysophaeum taylorii]|uniref:Uncharacterized protein n=1 Tax=Chrysophaeum taylorii TaxID=2483200 RepID=A0AAD7XF66_9STRA|nr:hypothetical protein CTAYLR_007697 [Chrysophaeum taylorii]
MTDRIASSSAVLASACVNTGAPLRFHLVVPDSEVAEARAKIMPAKCAGAEWRLLAESAVVQSIRDFGLAITWEIEVPRTKLSVHVPPWDHSTKHNSVFNCLRFYLPRLPEFADLESIIFMDDDIIVQGDLARLWAFPLEKPLTAGCLNWIWNSCARMEAFLDLSYAEVPYLGFGALPRGEEGSVANLTCASDDQRECAPAGFFTSLAETSAAIQGCRLDIEWLRSKRAWNFGLNKFNLTAWRAANVTERYVAWIMANKEFGWFPTTSLGYGLGIAFLTLADDVICTDDVGMSVLHGLGFVEPDDLNLSGIPLDTIGEFYSLHWNGDRKPYSPTDAIPEYTDYFLVHTPTIRKSGDEAHRRFAAYVSLRVAELTQSFHCRGNSCRHEGRVRINVKQLLAFVRNNLRQREKRDALLATTNFEVLRVQYESCVENKPECFRDVLAFLAVDNNERVLDELFASSSDVVSQDVRTMVERVLNFDVVARALVDAGMGYYLTTDEINKVVNATSNFGDVEVSRMPPSSEELGDVHVLIMSDRAPALAATLSSMCSAAKNIATLVVHLVVPNNSTDPEIWDVGSAVEACEGARFQVRSIDSIQQELMERHDMRPVWMSWLDSAKKYVDEPRYARDRSPKHLSPFNLARFYVPLLREYEDVPRLVLLDDDVIVQGTITSAYKAALEEKDTVVLSGCQNWISTQITEGGEIRMSPNYVLKVFETPHFGFRRIRPGGDLSDALCEDDGEFDCMPSTFVENLAAAWKDGLGYILPRDLRAGNLSTAEAFALHFNGEVKPWQARSPYHGIWEQQAPLDVKLPERGSNACAATGTHTFANSGIIANTFTTSSSDDTFADTVTTSSSDDTSADTFANSGIIANAFTTSSSDDTFADTVTTSSSDDTSADTFASSGGTHAIADTFASSGGTHAIADTCASSGGIHAIADTCARSGGTHAIADTCARSGGIHAIADNCASSGGIHAIADTCASSGGTHAGTHAIADTCASSGGTHAGTHAIADTCASSGGTHAIAFNTFASLGRTHTRSLGTYTITNARSIGTQAIADARAFGTHALSLGTYTIADARAFGTYTITNARAFGTHALSLGTYTITDTRSLRANAVADARSLRTYTITNARAVGTHALSLWTHAVADARSLGTYTIADARAFGTYTITNARAFGTHALSLGTYTITDTRSLWTHTIADTRSLRANAITDARAFGTYTITNTRSLRANAITDTRSLGTLTIADTRSLRANAITDTRSLRANAITDTRSLGTLTVADTRSLRANAITDTRSLRANAITDTRSLGTLTVADTRSLRANAITDTRSLRANAITDTRSLGTLTVADTRSLRANAITDTRSLRANAITDTRSLRTLTIADTRSLGTLTIADTRSLRANAITDTRSLGTLTIADTRSLGTLTIADTRSLRANAITDTRSIGTLTIADTRSIRTHAITDTRSIGTLTIADTRSIGTYALAFNADAATESDADPKHIVRSRVYVLFDDIACVCACVHNRIQRSCHDLIRALVVAHFDALHRASIIRAHDIPYACAYFGADKFADERPNVHPVRQGHGNSFATEAVRGYVHVKWGACADRFQ